MKYADYEKLRLVLEQDNSSINQLVLETLGKPLPINEAETQELDITEPGWGGITLTKSGRAQKQLNKAAKNLKKTIDNDIIEKYYPALLQDSKKVIQQSLNLRRQGKEVQEIANELKNNISIAQKASSNKLKVIDQAISKLIDNSNNKIAAYLGKQNLNDNNKLKLDNYWTLLTTQVHQNAYSAMIEQQTKFIEENIDDEGLRNLAKAALAAEQFEAQENKLERQVIADKEKITQPAETEPVKPAEEKPAEIEPKSAETKPAEPAKPAEEKPAEIEPAKPAEEKPAEIEPAKPAEEKPIETEPAETKTVEPSTKTKEPVEQDVEPIESIDDLNTEEEYITKDSEGNDQDTKFIGKNKNGDAIMAFVKNLKNKFVIKKDMIKARITGKKGGTMKDDIKGIEDPKKKKEAERNLERGTKEFQSFGGKPGYKMVAENLQDFLK